MRFLAARGEMQAMAARAANYSSVTATIYDEDTLDVNGIRYVREGQQREEVLLQPTTKAVAPRLRCSNCHFERQYTYWYQHLDYVGRIVNYCPGCGHKVMGVANAFDSDR